MIAIKNGRLVLPDRVQDGKILVLEDDRIRGIEDEIPQGADRVIDAHGRYVLPGFLDIHSDRIEQFILPRPTARFDFELALKECERELLHQGITTIFHSFSLYKDEKFGKSPLRTLQSVREMAALIRDIHDRYHLIHHRFHLRLEIDNLDAYDIAADMIEKGLIHEISFMDHSPGQGQFKNLAIYRTALAKYSGMAEEDYDFEGFLEREKNKEMLSFAQLRDLARLAHSRGIAVASHDDDTREKLDLNREIGVDISEFPITIPAAQYAKSLGFYTVVGAPNILRGGSHSGNMSAAEAVQAGCADILCSDYYPPAILHGVFLLHSKYGLPLPEVVRKATRNPALAVGLPDYGEIAPGRKADLLIVEILDNYPVITHVLVDGRATSRVEYRR